MSIMRCSKTEMEDRMNAIGKAFHKECAEKLHQMSEKEFSYLQMEFQEGYASKSLEYRVPKLHSVSVPLDSRLMKIEPSTDTKMPYVITITNPLKARQRMVVPINTSSHSLHKIKKMCIRDSYKADRVFSSIEPKHVEKVQLKSGYAIDETPRGIFENDTGTCCFL